MCQIGDIIVVYHYKDGKIKILLVVIMENQDILKRNSFIILTKIRLSIR